MIAMKRVNEMIEKIEILEIVNTVICYNNHEEIIEYATKLSSLPNSEKVALVVVINLLENEKVSQLKTMLKKVDLFIYLVQPKQNLGYMNGMIEGYRVFNEKIKPKNIKYIIMSNTDINYPETDFLKTLLSYQYPENIWVIGPAVYVPTRNVFYRPRDVKRRTEKEIKKLIRIFNTPFINELYIRMSDLKGKLLSSSRDNSRMVYDVHGCYFIIKKELADLMLSTPFGALLYSEEAYVAEMAWKNNKNAYYDSKLLVEHMEHSVTSKLAYKRIARLSAESLSVILRDFYQ
uniref:Glycosyltransferase n=2 Tax=Streptococcus suis TaxID=1307 RepID=A0A1C9IHB9_STRSU|nr:hypothetical protein YS205-orf11 [Streptococcus suis]AOP03662.1 hypothetical protein YS191-orf11 [Streptococcus suis]AOP03694.1 hypothetical protein YS196-orf11 [Streptococcus suis]